MRWRYWWKEDMDFRVNSYKPHNPKQHHWSLCLLVKQNKSFRMSGNTTSLALKWTKWSILLNSDACPWKIRGVVWVSIFHGVGIPGWATRMTFVYTCMHGREILHENMEGIILQCIVLRFSKAINIPSCRNASRQRTKKKWTPNIEMCVHCYIYT